MPDLRKYACYSFYVWTGRDSHPTEKSWARKNVGLDFSHYIVRTSRADKTSQSRGCELNYVSHGERLRETFFLHVQRVNSETTLLYVRLLERPHSVKITQIKGSFTARPRMAVRSVLLWLNPSVPSMQFREGSREDLKLTTAAGGGRQKNCTWCARRGENDEAS